MARSCERVSKERDVWESLSIVGGMVGGTVGGAVGGIVEGSRNGKMSRGGGKTKTKKKGLCTQENEGQVTIDVTQVLLYLKLRMAQEKKYIRKDSKHSVQTLFRGLCSMETT